MAHFSLLVANLIYALNYTVAKDVMPNYIEPSGFILLRVTGAVFLFFICYFFFLRECVAKRDIFHFAICGLFGIAINQLFFFEGLNLTTPINAAIIMTSNPVLVILTSAIIMKERITNQKVIGIFFGLIGAAILILNGGDFSTSIDYMKGNIFVLINAASYGVYLVLVKPLMEKYHPITVMTLVFGFGLFFVFPFGFPELLNVEWSTFSTKIIWKVIFVVICTTFIAYLLNASSLKHLMPSVVSIYIYLQPLFATIIAILLQSDKLDFLKVISCIFIFFGVYLVSKNKDFQIKNNLS